jgi:transposase-like protein
MNCVYCHRRVVKSRKDPAASKTIQTYRCNGSGRQFNERSGAPIARFRTPVDIISLAMNARNEGLSLPEIGRNLGKSGNSIVN